MFRRRTTHKQALGGYAFHGVTAVAALFLFLKALGS